MAKFRITNPILILFNMVCMILLDIKGAKLKCSILPISIKNLNHKFKFFQAQPQLQLQLWLRLVLVYIPPKPPTYPPTRPPTRSPRTVVSKTNSRVLQDCCSASTQVNSTSTQTKAEVSLITTLIQPPTHPPQTPNRR